MRKIASLVAAAVLLSIASAALSLAQQAPPAVGAPPAGPGAPGRAGAPLPPFRIMSPDLVDGSLLPQQFTCAAGTEAVSPPLQWMNAPRGTVSFALIVHDMEPRPQKKLDDILHWMVWNIPATATKFPQGIPSNTSDLPDGSQQTNAIRARVASSTICRRARRKTFPCRITTRSICSPSIPKWTCRKRPRARTL